MNGKGSGRRKTDEIQYRKNYDSIDWHKPKNKTKAKKMSTNPQQTESNTLDANVATLAAGLESKESFTNSVSLRGLRCANEPCVKSI